MAKVKLKKGECKTIRTSTRICKDRRGRVRFRKARTARQRSAPKKVCVTKPRRYKGGRCGCKTRGGGFRFLKKARCKRR